MTQSMHTVKTVGNKKLSFERKNSVSESSMDLTQCPLSGTKGKKIHRITMTNHVLPKYWPYLSEKDNFFCSHKDCPVVYFNNQTKTYFHQDELRTPVMHKMPIQSEGRPMCYCTGVLEQQIIDELIIKKCCDSLKDIQEYTGANLKQECRITNPSGRCCGKQIKQVIDWAKSERLEITSPLLVEATACCSAIIETKHTKN